MTIEQWLVGFPVLLALLNVAIAVTLASLVGLAVGRVGRSAALRHAILLASLVLVLLSPLIIGVATTGRLGWLAVAMKQVGQPTSNGAEDLNDVKREESYPVSAKLGQRDSGDEAALVCTKVLSGEPVIDENESPSVSEMDGWPQAENADSPRSVEIAAVPVLWWQLLGTLAVIAWFVGSAVAAVRVARGYSIVLRLRHSLRVASAEMQRLAQKAAKQVGLRATTRVLESGRAPTPLIVGFCQPVVVVPCGIEGQTGTEQLEGMLVHEMAHIARRDQWVGLLQRMATVLFWWQPLVRRLNSQLSAVREDLCDNYVIRQQGDGYAYAQALVELAARVELCRPVPSTIGLLEESDGLEGRVTRLLDSRRSSQTQLSRTARVAVGVCSMLLATMLIATTIRGVDAEKNRGNTEATVSANEIRVRDTDGLLRAARTARPGTTIMLEPGTYRGGLALNNLQGTAERPIVISAADPQNQPIIKGGNSCLHLTDPAHVELRNLVFTGARANGLNIDDGGSYDTPAHHVVLHGLTVQDIGSDRNHDGIKLSGLNDFRVESCTVERWGKTGSGIDMVGCHRGVVTESTFREGDKVFGNAVQMKGGSRDVTVSYCRFEDAGGRAINIGGSTGLRYFRPKPQGYEAKDITVADCTFVGSMAPIAFVGVDGANVHNNTIYRPTRWVIRILQENQNVEFVACRNGRFTNNIVVFRSDELAYAANIGSGTSPKSFKFSKNFWYCVDRPEKSKRAVQLPSAENNGVHGQNPKFGNADKGDFRLKPESPAKDFGPRAKRPQ